MLWLLFHDVGIIFQLRNAIGDTRYLWPHGVVHWTIDSHHAGKTWSFRRLIFMFCFITLLLYFDNIWKCIETLNHLSIFKRIQLHLNRMFKSIVKNLLYDFSCTSVRLRRLQRQLSVLPNLTNSPKLFHIIKDFNLNIKTIFKSTPFKNYCSSGYCTSSPNWNLRKIN